MEFSLVASRLLLASVFLLAGSAKFFDPVGSRKAMREFGLPAVLARPMVVLLPLLELAVAAALIPTTLAWYGAWGALALLAGFLIVVGIAMARGVKTDCHCFGQLRSTPVGWPTLVRNVLLGVCAGWLINKGRGQSGPALWTWFASLTDFETKVAIIAGCLLAFLFLRVLLRARPKTEAMETAPSFSLFGDDEEEESPAERVVPAPIPVEQDETAAAHPLDIGLPIGTPAPEFELPAITGEKHSLGSLRAGGRDILLIFSSPFCKSCEALASNLARWTRGMTGLPSVIVISRGSVQENLDKLKGFEPSQVLLQQAFEVAHAYDCSMTPTAVLVSADGLIRSQLVSGGLAIRQLLLSSMKRGDPAAAKTKAAQRASVFGG